MSLTQSGINMSGKHESSTLALVADGEEHPVSPQAPGVDASGAAFDQVIVFDREQPGA